LALRELGLTKLEAGELKALEPGTRANISLRNFVLGSLQAAGAWYDALVAATRLQNEGRLSAAATERIRYPLAYPELIVPAAHQASIQPSLVMALPRQESLFDPQARSVSDARGLMQLLPSTAARMAGEEGIGTTPNLYDPAVNVRLGVTYLKKLFMMYSRNQFKAVAAYNAGEHAVDRWNVQYPGPDDVWVENIAYRETRDYVKKVIGGLREYEILYGSAVSAAATGTAGSDAIQPD
jgi:soluble lytic murein transglycosylase